MVVYIVCKSNILESGGHSVKSTRRRLRLCLTGLGSSSQNHRCMRFFDPFHLTSYILDHVSIEDSTRAGCPLDARPMPVPLRSSPPTLRSPRLSPTARVESDLNYSDELAANAASCCTSLAWKKAQWGARG